MQGLVSRVEVSVMDAESVQVEDSLVLECSFPVRELLGEKFSHELSSVFSLGSYLLTAIALSDSMFARREDDGGS